MTQFDQVLRRGLMDANLARFDTVLRQADETEPEFSPYYLRERMKLLADPRKWMRQWAGPRRRRRVNWRIIALAAALLLLSACAYAVATGQFSQWFPKLGVDPEAPEKSEEVLARIGTVIQQSQTVDGVTVNLNAAVWDGEYVYLSFDIEGMDVPMEEVQRGYPLWSTDCGLLLRKDQREEYERNRAMEYHAGEEVAPEELEAEIQENMKKRGMALFPEEVGEHKLSFQDNPPLYAGWFTETTQPELTLHLENIAPAIYGEDGYPTPGEVFIEGPFDLTFTLKEPILPIRYDGASVDLTGTDYDEVERSFRVTGFEFSVTGLTIFYESPQLDETLPLEEWYEIKGGTLLAVGRSLQGLWTEDGTYVDMSSAGAGGGDGVAQCWYPYPIDPATVTAIEIGGVRVELRELERVTE